MRTYTRVAALMLASALLLAFAAGTASAERALEIRPAGPIVAEGPVRINEALRIINIECELLLRGMLVPIIQKASAGILPAGQIGRLTGLEFRACIDNTRRPWIVRFLEPVPVLYNSFLGSLPNITGILMTALNVGIRIMSGETNCLFRGPLPYLIYKSPGELRFNRKKFLENRLTYVEGNCPEGSWIELEGTLIINPPQEIVLV